MNSQRSSALARQVQSGADDAPAPSNKVPTEDAPAPATNPGHLMEEDDDSVSGDEGADADASTARYRQKHQEEQEYEEGDQEAEAEAQSSGRKNKPNRPVSHSARHQRPARERHIMRIASRENVDNQAPRNTNFTQ